MSLYENLIAYNLGKQAGGGTGGGGSSGSGWDGVYTGNGTWPVRVGNYMFYGNDRLKAVNMEYCDGVGDGAFSICRSLETVYINANRTYSKDGFKLGKNAFADCSNLKSVTLNNFAGFSNECCFQGCSSLETVHFSMPTNSSSGSVPIYEYCFENCFKLKNIDGFIGSVYSGGFARCESLEKLKLYNPDKIEQGAFVGCSSLSAVIVNVETKQCKISPFAFLGSKIMDENGTPTGEGFVYVPQADFEGIVTYMVTIASEFIDNATAEYVARAILRKIEDYPEICG